MVNVSVALDNRSCQCQDITSGDYTVMYAFYNYIVIIVMLPVVACFGVCSNILNLFLFTRSSLVNSGNTYLAALSISDFFVVITGMIMFWLDSVRTYTSQLKNTPYMMVYSLPFGYMAQTCSIYFTVAAAMDCYVKVCMTPFIDWCTVRKARQVIGATIISSFAYNSIRFFQYNTHHCFPNPNGTEIVEICITTFGKQIGLPYSVYLYLVLMTLLPFFLLSILNALIVKKVKGQSAAAAAQVSSDDTITMIMVVIMFLACNTLALVVNIVESFGTPGQVIMNYLSDTSNFLVIFNSSANFVVYMLFCDEFRRLFCCYFCCRQKNTKKALQIRGYTLVPSGETGLLDQNLNETTPADPRINIEHNLDLANMGSPAATKTDIMPKMQDTTFTQLNAFFKEYNTQQKEFSRTEIADEAGTLNLKFIDDTNGASK